MSVDPAPIRDPVTESTGAASRPWVAWFDAVKTAINTAVGMVYPGAGIAKSTGSGWDTSITDNSSHWNAAYTHKTTEDAVSGLVFGNGAGTYTGKGIGTDVQAHGAKLDSIQALANASGALTNDGSGGFSYVAPASMVYPGAGVPISTGSAWAASHANQQSSAPYTGTYAWDHAASLYVNVLDWGITPHDYSSTYCNNMANASAMAAAASANQSAWNTMLAAYSGTPRVFFFPASALQAYYFSAMLDLYTTQHSILGCGPDATNIVAYNHNTAGIRSGGHDSFLLGFCLHHLTAGSYGSFPSHISGQYGIGMTYGTSAEVWSNIWIRDCGDSALRLDISASPGGTGPAQFFNITADNIAGWWAEITNGVADLTFSGGGLDTGYGGISLTGSSAVNCHFRDIDIELGTAANASYSLFYSDGTNSHGCTMSGLTLSGSAGHGIYLGTVGGYTFTGGHYAMNPVSGASVELAGSTENITFVGGYSETCLVFASLAAGARNNTFIGVETGGTITDIAANKTVSINSPTCAGTNI